MEYKDIKTADELESWYAEKEDILEGYVRDYAVPFGNVYHLDSPGYVSEERWCDTLPSDRERSTFMALQNGVSTKEIIEHKDEFGWIDRMAMSSVADDYAECYMTQAGPDYLDEQEIMNVREQYPELIDSNGEIVWNDPDFVKRGVTFDVENFGEKYKIELSGIETNATETIVDISGKQYGLLAGKTFEDSQKLDAVLDMFPEYAIKDYKVPNKISVFIMPVQMYWKDDPSEIIETNFSFEDTCGLAIDDSVTFSGYTQNELVDMIGREDNGEDFVITGVGAGHYVGTCKKEPSKNKSVSEKTCNARESSGRLDADRNVDRNDIAKDKEVK